MKKISRIIVIMVFMLFATFLMSASAYDWSEKAGFGNKANAIAISPNYLSDHTLLVGLYSSSSNEIYKSVDGGQSWNPFSDGFISTQNNVSQIVYAPDKSIILAATENGGIYKLVNGETSWTKMNTGITGTGSTVFVKSIAFSPNYAIDGIIFAGTSALPGSDNNLFKWNGSVWEAKKNFSSGVSSIVTSTHFSIDQSVYVSLSSNDTNPGPTNGANVIKSTNQGETWTGMSSVGLPSDINVLAYSSATNNIFAGSGSTSGSIFRFNSSLGNWSKIDSGLPSGNVRAISVSPVDNHTLFTVLISSGSRGVYKSNTNETNWTSIFDLSGGSQQPYSLGITPSTVAGSIIFTGVDTVSPVGGKIYSSSFDEITPTTTLEIASLPSSGVYSTPPSITLNRNEPGQTYYAWNLASGPFTPYVNPMVAPVGVNTLYYYSVDNAGNVELVKSYSVNVVKPALSTQLTLKVSAKKIRAGQAVTVKGEIRDINGMPVVGKKVSIQAKVLKITKKKVKGKNKLIKKWIWKTIAKVTTNSQGIFSKKLKPKTTTSYRAVFGKDVGYNAANSKTVKVIVNKVKKKK